MKYLIYHEFWFNMAVWRRALSSKNTTRGYCLFQTFLLPVALHIFNWFTNVDQEKNRTIWLPDRFELGSEKFQNPSLFLGSVSINCKVKTFEMHLHMKHNIE